MALNEKMNKVQRSQESMKEDVESLEFVEGASSPPNLTSTDCKNLKK